MHWTGQPETATSTRRHERAARDRTKKDKQAGHCPTRDRSIITIRALDRTARDRETSTR